MHEVTCQQQQDFTDMKEKKHLENVKVIILIVLLYASLHHLILETKGKLFKDPEVRNFAVVY